MHRLLSPFLWPPYVIGQAIIFSPCAFFYLSSIFFFSPNLSRRRLDVYHTSTHGVACGLSANLKCSLKRGARSLLEMQDPKNRHLGTVTQLCRAISSQLRHVSRLSTIGKNWLSSNISCTCPHNMVNFGPLVAEISSVVWGTRANFNGFTSWQRYCMSH